MSYPWGRKPKTCVHRGALRSGYLPRPRVLRFMVALAVVAMADVYDANQPVWADPPALGTLPVFAPNPVVSGTVRSIVVNGTTMDVNQASQSAHLRALSLNLASNAHLNINQEVGVTSRTLIQVDPASGISQVYGRITAQGQLILFNRAGFVFGGTSRIDTRSTIATALDPSNVTELLDRFTPEDPRNPVFEWRGDRAGFESVQIQVEPGAQFRSNGANGSVMLFAPRVVNAGTIQTPDGQAILAAGAKVYLAFEGNPDLRGFLVEVDPYNLLRDVNGNPVVDENGQPMAGSDGPTILGGEVTNTQLGRIIAERGNVTMAGYTVNQNGLVGATTAVNSNGSIILKAGDTAIRETETRPGRTNPYRLAGRMRRGTLTLGQDSVTEILPELDDRSTIPTADIAAIFNRSYIELAGNRIELQSRAQVFAPGGNVFAHTFSRADILPNQIITPAQPSTDLIYLGPDSVIDVSGIEQYLIDMERNFIPVRLFGNELKDVPPQRDDFLYRQEVWIDIRRRYQVADFSGYVSQVGRTVGELSTEGGSITLRTQGAVVTRTGSLLDVSGGSVRYRDGFGRTTQLVDSSGRIYDISVAPLNNRYVAVTDTVTRVNRKFGTQQVWGVPGSGVQLRRYQGYVEGRNGGALNIVATAGAYEGAFAGHITYSAQQRYFDSLPLAASLRIGYFDTPSGNRDYLTPDIVIDPIGTLLLDGFNPDFAAQPGDDWRDTVRLSSRMLSASGFGGISLASNGRIHLTEDARLDLTPGASLTLTGRELDIEGDVIAPAGSIKLSTVDIGVPVPDNSDIARAQHRLHIGTNSLLSTAGLWVNQWSLGGYGPAAILPIDGGSITIASAADAILDTGSILDVSGGAVADAGGRVQGGSGGSIDISNGRFGLGPENGQVAQTSRLQLGSELRGYGLTMGGTLKIDTTRVRVGGELGSDPLEFHAGEDFFHRGGFSSFNLNGHDGLTVVAGARVHPVMSNFILPQDMLFRPSGGGLYGVAGLIERPSYARMPVSLTLSANSKFFGRLMVEENGELRTDAEGKLTLDAGRQITVLGTLAAPAGTITLSTLGLDGNLNSNPYFDNQSIWLGSTARLLANGTVVLEPNDNGLRTGRVLNGGSVSLLARFGFIVTEEGSSIEVSGVATELDLPSASAAGRERVTVSGDAGRISLRGREGMLLGGRYAAQAGGPGARGGTLDIEVSPRITIASANQFFPNTQRVIRVSENSNSFMPAGLRPGDVIERKISDTSTPDPYSYAGKAYLDMGKIRNGGFDSLALKADDRIEFNESFTGSTALSLRRNLTLDAPIIAAALDVQQIDLRAAYIALANLPRSADDVRPPGTLTAGSANFDVHARHIDLIGHVGLSGMRDVRFDSEGDIRAIGVSIGNELTGSLTSAAQNLTLRGRQIYPATLTDYRVQLSEPNAAIHIASASAVTSVLSAGGRITFTAPNIEQAGSVKAPFGQIVFDASTRLTLGPGSLTSVSGEGQLIPFGRTTLDGELLVYDVDVEGNSFNVITATPQKSVVLRSPNVDVTPGAMVDLNGGGDLVSFEFTPGPPGRSIDILDPALAGNSFAILPTLNSEFASYDQQYYLNTGATAGPNYLSSGITPGESVYLSGVPGLQAGVYAKLPARYAALDGAYLATPVANSTDASYSVPALRPDGTRTVGGYNVSRAAVYDSQLDTLNAATLGDARRSAFSIKTAEQVRYEADYRPSRASALFASNAALQLPVDAGRLVIDAGSALSFAGHLRAAPAAGGRGGEVDITANQIAIAAAGTTGIAGFVRLDPETMRSFSSASLMIGGTREASADGVIVNVRAQDVVVANSENQPLEAPEILLVASNSVQVRTGSVVRATGNARLNGADLILPAEDINNTPSNTGDDIARRAGLLRVSVGDQVGVRRPGQLAQTNNSGSVIIDSGATVSAARSTILDATQALSNTGTLRPGRALAIGAPRINLGNNVPELTPGLTLSGDNLTSLYAEGSAVDSLTLRSYTSIDLYNDVDVTGSIREIGLEAPQIRGLTDAGSTTTLRAGSFTIGNASGTDYRDLSGSSVSGRNLALDATDSVRLGRGNVRVDGFTAVGFTAGRELRIEGNGQLDVAAPLTITTPRITAASGTDYTIRAIDERSNAATVWHALTVNPLQATNQTAITDLGARIGLYGQSVALNSSIELPAGRAGLYAMGSGTGDNVSLGVSARILAHGVERRFADSARYAPGGDVILSSAQGSISMDAAAVIDVSGRGDAEAGSLSVSAVNGTATLAGSLNGAAGIDADPVNQSTGGRFRLDVGSLADSDQWSDLNTRLNGATPDRQNFSGSRDFRIRTGDINIATTDTITTHELRVATDRGSIELAGTIDASGRAGGRVELWAGNNVTLSRGSAISTVARGVDEAGGTVILGARTGTVAMEADQPGLDNGARIHVAGTGTALDANGLPVAADRGIVWVRVPRSTDNSGFAPVTLSDNIIGAREIVIEPVRAYSGTSVTAALIPDPVNDPTNSAFNHARDFAGSESVGRQLNDLRSALGTALGAALHLRPGIEVTSSNNLSLDSALDLQSTTYRFNGEPGVLTLRAAGNLTFTQSLSDGFSTVTSPSSSTVTLQEGNSWSYRLVAGADGVAAGGTSAAPTALQASDSDRLRAFVNADAPRPNTNDPLVDVGVGNVVIGSNQWVRTGTGFIDVFAGRDVVLQDAGSVLYTAGKPSSSPDGFSPVTIIFSTTVPGPVPGSTTTIRNRQAPVYPTDGGAVRVVAQGDVYGRAPGWNASSRVSNQLVTDWLFREGQLNAAGNVERAISWYPRFDRFKQGIGTLGGGNLLIEAGGNLDNLSAVVSTSGRVAVANGSSTPTEDRLEVLGGGNLLARAGGDIIGGVFYVGRGNGRLLAGGAVRSGDSVSYNTNAPLQRRTLLALGDAGIRVQAAGNLTVGALFNPTLVPQIRANTGGNEAARTVFSTYTDRSGVDLMSLSGDIELAPDTELIQGIDALKQTANGTGTQTDRFETEQSTPYSSFLVAPSSLHVAALNGDVRVNVTPASGPLLTFLKLFPARHGNLELLAQDSVRFGANTAIVMSDAAPAGIAPPWRPDSSYDPRYIGNSFVNGVVNARPESPGALYHANPLLHADVAGEPRQPPIRIVAQTGDVVNEGSLLHGFAKAAQVYAGRDIRNFRFVGQNVNTYDVTRLEAGRDMVFDAIDSRGAPVNILGGIVVAGPGRVEVIAGRNIDLGASEGILTIGNDYNPFLPDRGADIVAFAGLAQPLGSIPFIERYLDGSSVPLAELPVAERELYRNWLQEYVRAPGEVGAIDPVEAQRRFEALTVDRQRPLLQRIVVNEIIVTGDLATDTNSGALFNDYSRAYRAISTLFPGPDGRWPVRGDINLFFSQIKTKRGGDIQLWAPGGDVNAGLATSGGLSKSAAELGIVTLSGGNISAVVGGDFLVNQSRVFTLQGGDLLLWSSDGDIDAGRGAKTSSSTVPPRLRLSAEGQIEYDVTGAVAGSGIAVLKANPDVIPGKLRLFAPRGTIRAGDAGIRAFDATFGGNIEGGDNISIGGKTNIQLNPNAGVGSDITGAGDATGTATKGSEESLRTARKDDESAGAFLDVEVVGFGEGEISQEKSCSNGDTRGCTSNKP